jgi:hypothetical protein
MNPSTALRRATGRALLAEKMARSRAAMVGGKILVGRRKERGLLTVQLSRQWPSCRSSGVVRYEKDCGYLKEDSQKKLGFGGRGWESS